MSNPWLKKNPFMSLWLSGANRMAASARGQVAAAARRQIDASVAQASKDTLAPWFGTTGVAKRKAKAKARTPRR